MRDWTKTEITALLKIDYPIVQGPFGRGGSTALLTATVSNRGGLGSFGANDLDAPDITKIGAEIRALTDKPFSMNLWVSTFDLGGDALEKDTYDLVLKILRPFYDELGVQPPVMPPPGQAKNFESQMQALLEVKPALFSFVFGIPSKEILDECRKRGIYTAGAASTVDEALALEEAGVDMIVASGFEAGGHRPSFLRPAEDSLVGTIALVPQIADKVRIPVIAAGGIADGRGVAAALMLGASAVQIGTAFLACDESGASDAHRKLLFQDDAKYTGLSRAYTGRLARGLYNRFAKELKPFESTFAKYPAHSWIVASLKAAAIAQGRNDLVALWAGQAAPLVKHHKAADVLDAIVRETTLALQQ
ncbi:MAG: nitronate monooxygenase [Candidatus Melainabacteria bacterium]|nr:nitronate monooxygenase [Candidatus Melainabacteria bacterium]